MGPGDAGVGWGGGSCWGFDGKAILPNCIVHIKQTTTRAKAGVGVGGGERLSRNMAGMSWQGGEGSEDSVGIRYWSLGIPWPGKDIPPHLRPTRA